MKAISIHQPYAWLMLHGKIETRSWPTKYRGPVLICSTKIDLTPAQIIAISGPDQFWRISSIALKDEGFDLRSITGHAIAVGDLVDCHPMYPSDEDKCFVELDTRLYCHVYENVRAIEPIPVKGQQRLFEVSFEERDLKFINTAR